MLTILCRFGEWAISESFGPSRRWAFSDCFNRFNFYDFTEQKFVLAKIQFLNFALRFINAQLMLALTGCTSLKFIENKENKWIVFFSQLFWPKCPDVYGDEPGIYIQHFLIIEQNMCCESSSLGQHQRNSDGVHWLQRTRNIHYRFVNLCLCFQNWFSLKKKKRLIRCYCSTIAFLSIRERLYIRQGTN